MHSAMAHNMRQTEKLKKTTFTSSLMRTRSTFHAVSDEGAWVAAGAGSVACASDARTSGSG